jgi:LysR family nitrogen assimilation transcriptional regulator
MNLRHLAYFVRIADLGSFTKAAQHLRVAQPALTRHIHQLEAKFGIELFFRSSRGVVLTEAGKHLYDNATRILHDIERTSDEMRSFAGIPSGKIVLGVTPSLCPVVVPTLLSRHRRKLPGVELKIVESYGGQLEEWLVDRRIDLAIHTEPIPNKLLACTSLATEEMVLVTRSDRGYAEPVSAMDLGSIPLTMTDSLRVVVEQLLEPLHINLLVDTTLNAIPTILLMVREGLCASVLPYSAARADTEAGILRAHRVTEHGLTRNLVLSANAARPMSGPAQAVANVIRDVFETLTKEGAFRLSPSA